jgi:enhancing lycopene biosynthesis protein 2
MSPPAPAAPLTAATLAALRNLARKRAGEPVGWIAIARAQELTLLGYAVRNQSGWQITASGVDALAAMAGPTAAAPADASVIPFQPR